MPSRTAPASNDPQTLATPEGCAAVLACARQLQCAAAQGIALQRTLRGKHFGLVDAGGDDADTGLFCAAVNELGGAVARIRPPAANGSLEPTARLLGRLYDAIECQGLERGVVASLAQYAGIPVFDGIATARHATAALAAQLGGSGHLADKRRWVLEAALLLTLG